MMGILSRRCFIILALVLSLLMVGCDSQDLGETPEEPEEIDRTLDRGAGETCAICHGPEKIAGADAVHREMAFGTQAVEGGFTARIDAVTIPDADTAGGPPTVDFTVRDEAGRGVPGLTDIRLIIAKLIPGTEGRSSRWQSYINRTAVKEPGDPGTAPDGTAVVQATAERDGTLVDLGGGAYSYRFATDLGRVATEAGAPLTVPYEPGLTHRVAIQIEGEGGRVANPVHDFIPATGRTEGIPDRDIAAIGDCNKCHHRLAFHGGGRVAVEYCVTCHNPGTADPNSGRTLDMTAMTHKIHMGADLPSVEAGEPYVIWGFRDSEHDYSHVELPLDIRNCERCHRAGNPQAPDGENWRTTINTNACVSCHDNISFTAPPPPGMVLHSEGPREDSSGCADCHLGFVESAHAIPERRAAERFAYNILGVTDTDPGSRPRVTISVTDPARGDAPYDLATDPAFTSDASRLALIIGWPASGYRNFETGNDPSLPVSVNVLTDAVANGDGTFTVTSPVPIPADVEGTGAAALEGHPAADPDGDGIFDLEVPVTNAVHYFAVTDPAPYPRRGVVDLQGCNDCHGTLSVHGNNRTDNIDVCVICHNGFVTDINRRPEEVSETIDDQRERTVDFKYMIHAIHGAPMRQEAYVAYGFGGRSHDFGDVEYPGNLRYCEACHFSRTYEIPAGYGFQATTVDTGEEISDPGDDRYTTPATSACSSCHDGPFAGTHMQQNGGGFDLGGAARPSGDGGEEIVQPPGHPQAPNCTTAFECHS